MDADVIKNPVNLYRHKLYVLYKCLYQWQALASDGHANKDNYWDMRYISDVVPMFECYCCEYAASFSCTGSDSRDCGKCPLNGFAWEGGKYKHRIYCCADDSIYQKWDDVDIDEDSSDSLLCRKEYYAQLMVEGIQKAIRNELGLEIEIKGDRNE